MNASSALAFNSSIVLAPSLRNDKQRVTQPVWRNIIVPSGSLAQIALAAPRIYLNQQCMKIEYRITNYSNVFNL